MCNLVSQCRSSPRQVGKATILVTCFLRPGPHVHRYFLKQRIDVFWPFLTHINSTLGDWKNYFGNQWCTHVPTTPSVYPVVISVWIVRRRPNICLVKSVSWNGDHQMLISLSLSSLDAPLRYCTHANGWPHSGLDLWPQKSIAGAEP